MPDEFDELFVKEDDLVDKAFLKEILIKYLKLTERGEVILEKEFQELPNTEKIILYLLARKVLKLKNILQKEEAGPTEISNYTGLPTGSVKSVFHFSKDNVFQSINGEYKIPNYAIKKAIEMVSPSESSSSTISKAIKSSDSSKKSMSSKKIIPTKRIEKITKELDRTKYPKLYSLSKAKDRAIYLLKILKEAFSIDGASITEMSYLLTDIFRLPTSAEALSMALMTSKEVHRYKESFEGKTVYLYKLMDSGEKYINQRLSELKS